MPTLSLTVNGQAESLQIPADRLLVDVLRQDLGLTGTHVGCDTAQCGACTVLLNGHAVKACNVLALQAAGCEISTIEGLSPPDGSLHVMQQAFKDCHGLQCGFCTPGMVMSAVDLVQNHACESEADIRNGLDGNFCRCTGYQNIVRAVQQGAAQMKG
ncbi:(2Fe-2S)-binding protein [Pseudorhodoferax sp.]|jgi:carbon-monoxide dehydrogenase small subunit|uniref:(2Fe-2S)-binding protein n=1 Tax=Pseudorhodoferax sp. TaxID=1993553 RepID=UPI001B59B174|nr:(2Fe-2S)-binding protein [Pseudorhodoferax sp.]MBP8143991.1 (2Fe-2S)-binding protein [Inhella sp.]